MIELLNMNFHGSVAYSHERGENLGFGYLKASLMQNGYNVVIREICGIDDLEQILISSPMVVGMSPFIHEFSDAAQFCANLKKSLPNVRIIWGGIPATSCVKEVLKEFEVIDFVIRGEGEYTFLELVRCLIANGCMEDIDGIGYRQGNEVVINPPGKAAVNLDLLPMACHDLLSDKRISFARISGSRGCYGYCSFCSSPTFFRNEASTVWRGHSVERVVMEMETVFSQYGIREFYFSDASMEDPPGLEGKTRLNKMAELILERDWEIYYRAFFRGDAFCDADKLLIDKLAQSGLEKVLIGVETVSQELLKLFNKRASVEQCVKTFELLKQAGILVEMGFICFTPYSSMEDLIEQATFLFELGIAKQFSYFFTQLEVYPDAPIKKQLIKDRLILPDAGYRDLFGYRFIHPQVDLVLQTIKKLQQEKLFALLKDEHNSEIVLKRINRRLKIKDDSSLDNELRSIQAEMNNYYFGAFMKIIMRCKNGESCSSLHNDILEKSSLLHNKLKRFKKELALFCSRSGISISDFSGRVRV